ncbi:MAG: ATP-dependent protease ATPase subunit HslU [Treponemataceae bacterium]|nr:MAG: ATP-dependent protease ATPase subunit HslU [Treponemataceae bacterium]
MDLTPKQIVAQLDSYIIGQAKAKKAVAIALRNRTRRIQLPEDIRDEIAPKNILMIGPTGVGKTEIARRLAKLCNAPFLKVEATKYTEVGYVGRDVESMIRDLMAIAVKMVKAEMQEGLKNQAEARVEEDLLDLLVPGSSKNKKKKASAQQGAGFLGFGTAASAAPASGAPADTPEELPPLPEEGSKQNAVETREKFRAWLRAGKIEDRTVDITVQPPTQMPSMEIFAGGNMEDLESSLQNITAMITGGKGKRKTLPIAEARKIIMEEHLDRMLDPDKVAGEAKKRVEQIGIIFIDEIDKIAVRGQSGGNDVSREGVQRDILPIVEGASVNTKYGVVDTTHILFIAAGAFSLSKPSDLIPELQGRFPLRVELDSLHADDFKRILLEPKNALTRQYQALLSTEKLTIKFTDSSIDRMSFLAADVNAHSENIGARRLHTIMETVLEDISFTADEHPGETIEIDAGFVDERLKDIVENQDLSRYVL